MTRQMEDSEEDYDHEVNGHTFLARLNWADILFPHLMPYLTVEDCFKLRSTCSLALQFVDEYFASVKVLDLSNRRNLSEEGFKVGFFIAIKDPMGLRQLKMALLVLHD